MHLASSTTIIMLQEVKCAYSAYGINDASSNKSAHVLLFPFIDNIVDECFLFQWSVVS